MCDLDLPASDMVPACDTFSPRDDQFQIILKFHHAGQSYGPGINRNKLFHYSLSTSLCVHVTHCLVMIIMYAT